MSNTVLLDNVAHHDLTVRIAHGAAHGDAVNQVLVFPPEFEAVQRDYPILLRRDERGGWLAVALLGFARDENLFLGDDGAWQARYVPAIRRRGPFSADGSDPAALRIDLDDPRVERGGGGEPLYLRHGGTAPYLTHIAAVLDVVRTGHGVMRPLYAAWEACGLLRQTTLDIEVGDGETYVIDDVFVIAEDKLAALDADTLHRLHRSGALRAAMMVAASLDNLHALIARRQRRATA